MQQKIIKNFTFILHGYYWYYYYFTLPWFVSSHALPKSRTRLHCSSDACNVTRIPKRRSVDIRYVDWAGSRGLLPLQRFKNPMEKDKYKRWLRKELPTNWSEEFINNVETLDIYDAERVVQIKVANQEEDFKQRSEEYSSNKVHAEQKASKPLNPNIHLQPIYIDSHIVVVNKESGVLSVPGPRRNPSVGGLVHEYFGNDDDDVDTMIVHRLDMDTSGIICYARNQHVLSVLHEAFRNKSQSGVVGHGEERQTVYKKYVALVCGHMQTLEGEIDLPLVRDEKRPPFMKIAMGVHNRTVQDLVSIENDDFSTVGKHRGYMKMMSKAPKESLSLYRILGWEYLDGLPVTRLELIPITGRTHQLRVHCAAIGHPIVGDCIYGYQGDGSPNGGLPDDTLALFPSRASDSLQQQIHAMVKKKQQFHNVGEYHGDMCLHAKQLCFLHPITKAPMLFENDAPF